MTEFPFAQFTLHSWASVSESLISAGLDACLPSNHPGTVEAVGAAGDVSSDQVS